ncbi:glycosyltransferase [Candidatus Uhrbacteria bacterium]|nr:glycosyltransferase [Candidatus Uhrbacteria bacterium]
MKLALVHDHLVQDGGAERVLQAFTRIWPEAPIYTLLYDPARIGDAFRDRVVRTSFLQALPLALRKYKWFLPMMPAATERHNLADFDVVVSSASAFAKGVLTRPDTLHLCYCHTPTRYLWSDTHSYVDELGLPGPVRKLVPLILTSIRMWDRIAAERADVMIANSETVRRRIRHYYGRESVVIHPPVETAKFSPAAKTENYYLAGGRLVAYKRFDVVVQAFNKLGLPLKIFGEGPELRRLQAASKKNIEFVGRVSEADKAELYRKSIAYIHPQEEDFGITAVEAMASGRPVIAYRKGGALETVVEGVTGTFIDEQSWEALANTVILFQPERFDPARIRAHAERFDIALFRTKMKELVESEWQRRSGSAAAANARLAAPSMAR